MRFAILSPAVLLAAVSLFTSCRRESAPQGELQVPVQSPRLAADAAAEETMQAPKVPVDRGESLSSVINCNLDLDLNEEQILVLRRKGEPEATLRIAVADYDSVRGSYMRTWEGPTSATNL
jgi:hypothetical protein